jgi:bacterioferritin (cytochrome b1)
VPDLCGQVLLVEGEEHVERLETQRHLIERVGYETYGAQQTLSG